MTDTAPTTIAITPPVVTARQCHRHSIGAGQKDVPRRTSRSLAISVGNPSLVPDGDVKSRDTRESGPAVRRTPRALAHQEGPDGRIRR
jgi:hypothetical protein